MAMENRIRLQLSKLSNRLPDATLNTFLKDLSIDFTPKDWAVVRDTLEQIYFYSELLGKRMEIHTVAAPVVHLKGPSRRVVVSDVQRKQFAQFAQFEDIGEVLEVAYKLNLRGKHINTLVAKKDRLKEKLAELKVAYELNTGVSI
jgi:hypothetical protein